MAAWTLVSLRIGIEVAILASTLLILRFALDEFKFRKGYKLVLPRQILGYVLVVGLGLILLLNLSALFPPAPLPPEPYPVVTPNPVPPSPVPVPPQPPNPAPPNAIRFNIAAMVVVLSATAFLASFFIPDLTVKRKVRQVAPVFFAGSLTWSVFEKFHLLQLDVKQQIKLEFSRARPLTFRAVGDVGPFVPGAADRLEPITRGTNGIESVVAGLEEQLDRNAVSLVFVLGGVDKRLLQTAPAGAFGSNEALAKARARWTVDSLKRRLPKLNSIEVLTLSTGSSYFGRLSASDSMRADRKVHVLVGR